MKLTLFLLTGCIVCAGSGSAKAQAKARIIGGVSDAKPSLPAPPKVLPNYKINWSSVQQKKDHKVIFNKVEAPAVVARQPVQYLSQAEIDQQNAEVLKWVRTIKESGGFFTVSATIYDHKSTYVRWWNGREEFAAWSNVDWNHLGGFHEFEGRGKRFSFMLFSGNTSMAVMQCEKAAGYREALPAIPELPNLTEKGASYMLVKGDEKNDEGMEFIEAIHDLYAAEKKMLANAYQERLKNWEISSAKQKALRDNPPPKPDIVINYWKKKTAPKAGNQDEANAKGKEGE